MAKSREPSSFGILLRQYRLAVGLTQEALAERTGLGSRSIQHLEGGENLPHGETVVRLIRGLGLNDDERRDFERLARPTRRVTEAVAGFDRSERSGRDNLPVEVTSFYRAPAGAH